MYKEAHGAPRKQRVRVPLIPLPSGEHRPRRANVAVRSWDWNVGLRVRRFVQPFRPVPKGTSLSGVQAPLDSL